MTKSLFPQRYWNDPPHIVSFVSFFASIYMIFWSKDAPELAYIVESSEAQYIPDVFFMEKDEYGNEIKKIGRPLPVEYLLIDVPVTTPLQVVVCDCEYLFCVLWIWFLFQPLQTFHTLPAGKNPFPVENRLLESSIQVTLFLSLPLWHPCPGL